jgi:hypothetical protein
VICVLVSFAVLECATAVLLSVAPPLACTVTMMSTTLLVSAATVPKLQRTFGAL